MSKLQRAQQWRAVVAEAFPGMTVEADDRVRADLAQLQIGEVMLSTVRSEHARVQRQASLESERRLVLHVARHGQLLVSQAGRQALCTHGQIVVTDASQPYSIDVSDRNDCLVLDVPATALDDDPSARDWRATVVAGVGVVPSMISAMVDDIWASNGASVPARLDQAIVSLIRLLDEEKSEEGIASARDGCISYVLTNLADPDLSLSRIAASCGLSKRGVQRMFLREFALSPMAFVTKWRLQRAAEMLVDRSMCSMADVSQDCGYNDPAYFSRVFRRQFGVGPSQWAKRQAG